MLWDLEQHARSTSYLLDAGAGSAISYDQLLERVVGLQGLIQAPEKRLIALFCHNTVDSLCAYLAGLRSGHAMILANGSMDRSLKDRLIAAYKPEILFDVAGVEPPTGYASLDWSPHSLGIAFASRPEDAAIHPSTALLLSTSGTTGNPKLVRLSYDNVQSNAQAIAEYLSLNPAEVAITSLPMSYSYGLSVINSHLLVGASVICTDASIVTRQFWSAFQSARCTSLAGVPYTYQALEQIRFGGMKLPSLRTMTQAGGRLPPDRAKTFARLCRGIGARLFVMYGQTEATARISYVPSARCEDKVGSVGIPIPGGGIRISLDGQVADGGDMDGEIIYEGPNVMLGYAERRSDLGMDDELRGTLHTGDVGYLDEEGYLYITGRLKRFSKVLGLRLNLDDVEGMLEAAIGRPVACVGNDDYLRILIETSNDNDVAEAVRKVSEAYRLHHSIIRIQRTSSLPVTAVGKRDYDKVSKLLDRS